MTTPTKECDHNHDFHKTHLVQGDEYSCECGTYFIKPKEPQDGVTTMGEILDMMGVPKEVQNEMATAEEPQEGWEVIVKNGLVCLTIGVQSFTLMDTRCGDDDDEEHVAFMADMLRKAIAKAIQQARVRELKWVRDEAITNTGVIDVDPTLDKIEARLASLTNE